jgi:hypothetical protein
MLLTAAFKTFGLLRTAAFLSVAGGSKVICDVWRQNPVVTAAVLECVVRLAAEVPLKEQRPGFLHAVVSSTLAALQQLQQPTPPAQASPAAAVAASSSSSSNPAAAQRMDSSPPGLLLTCLKVLSKGLEQGTFHPARVVAAVSRIAPLCPGLCSLVEGQLASGLVDGAQLQRPEDVAAFLTLAEFAPARWHQSGSGSCSTRAWQLAGAIGWQGAASSCAGAAAAA